MSKIGIAICFFVLGCAFSVIASPFWIKAQEGTPQSDEHRTVINGGFVKRAGQQGLGIDGAVPEFRPLRFTPIVKDFFFGQESQALDGLDCRILRPCCESRLRENPVMMRERKRHGR